MFTLASTSTLGDVLLLAGDFTNLDMHVQCSEMAQRLREKNF